MGTYLKFKIWLGNNDYSAEESNQNGYLCNKLYI